MLRLPDQQWRDDRHSQWVIEVGVTSTQIISFEIHLQLDTAKISSDTKALCLCPESWAQLANGSAKNFIHTRLFSGKRRGGIIGSGQR